MDYRAVACFLLLDIDGRAKSDHVHEQRSAITPEIDGIMCTDSDTIRKQSGMKGTLDLFSCG